MKTVDAGIHIDVPGIEALYPYLPDSWVEQIGNTVFRGPLDSDAPMPPGIDATIAPGSRGAGGAPDRTTVERDAISNSVESAILLCTYAVDSLHNPDQAIALARAVNDWQIAEWLDRDPRLRCSIVVPSKLPQASADEVDRVGDHPGFVQVALPARSAHPWGNRIHHPLWQAIDRHRLVGGVFFGGAPGNPPTPVGWPSTFIEEYVGMTGVFASQLTNIVSEGLFDEFPSLRITFIESGTTWLPAHMWRFDREWKNLRLQVPWVKRKPWSYVREHMRFTINPWDLPRDDDRLREILEHLGSTELLLYASGYPHATAGTQDHLISRLTDDERSGVLHDNARAWYDL